MPQGQFDHLSDLLYDRAQPANVLVANPRYSPDRLFDLVPYNNLSAFSDNYRLSRRTSVGYDQVHGSSHYVDRNIVASRQDPPLQQLAQILFPPNDAERFSRSERQALSDLRVDLPDSNLVVDGDSRIISKIAVYPNGSLTVILLMRGPAESVRLSLTSNLDNIARGQAQLLNNLRIYPSNATAYIALKSVGNSQSRSYHFQSITSLRATHTNQQWLNRLLEY